MVITASYFTYSAREGPDYVWAEGVEIDVLLIRASPKMQNVAGNTVSALLYIRATWNFLRRQRDFAIIRPHYVISYTDDLAGISYTEKELYDKEKQSVLEDNTSVITSSTSEEKEEGRAEDAD